MLKRRFLAVGLAAISFLPSATQAKEWLVERVSGTVWAMGPDRNPQRVEPKMTVPEGVTITTTADGRVRLSSENSVMTLAPNSVVAVFSGSSQSRTVNVLQKTGSVEFDVEKRAKPYFTVSSPYMAAVVKGTKFTISVARKATQIGVARGLVQVTDIRSGQTSAVGAGQGAQVSAAKTGLSTSGPVSPQVFQGMPQQPVVPPVGLSLPAFRAQAQQNASPETSPPSRQGETPTTAPASSFSSGYAVSRSPGAAGRTNSVGGSGNGSGHRGNAEAIGGDRAGASDSDKAAGGHPRGRNGQGRDDNGERPGRHGSEGPGGRNDNGRGHDGNGPKGPGTAGPKGPGGPNGNGSKGPDGAGGDKGSGKGPGGKGADNPGGPGAAHGPNGHGPEGTRTNGPKGPGGNGQGNNGNGKGNGGGDGSNAGGNGQGNDGNANGSDNGKDGKAK